MRTGPQMVSNSQGRFSLHQEPWARQTSFTVTSQWLGVYAFTQDYAAESPFKSELYASIQLWLNTPTDSRPLFSFFFKCRFYLFIYFWLRWVFVAARGLSLVAVSRGYSLLRCAGFSLRWLLLSQSTGSRRAGFSSCGSRASVVVAPGL